MTWRENSWNEHSLIAPVAGRLTPDRGQISRVKNQANNQTSKYYSPLCVKHNHLLSNWVFLRPPSNSLCEWPLELARKKYCVSVYQHHRAGSCTLEQSPLLVVYGRDLWLVTVALKAWLAECIQPCSIGYPMGRGGGGGGSVSPSVSVLDWIQN